MFGREYGRKLRVNQHGIFLISSCTCKLQDTSVNDTYVSTCGFHWYAPKKVQHMHVRCACAKASRDKFRFKGRVVFIDRSLEAIGAKPLLCMSSKRVFDSFECSYHVVLRLLLMKIQLILLQL